jgi:hypothetical protein
MSVCGATARPVMPAATAQRQDAGGCRWRVRAAGESGAAQLDRFCQLCYRLILYSISRYGISDTVTLQSTIKHANGPDDHNHQQHSAAGTEPRIGLARLQSGYQIA